MIGAAANRCDPDRLPAGAGLGMAFRLSEVFRFEMTSAGPPHWFEYRIRGRISLLLPRGAFVVVSDDGGSQFTTANHDDARRDVSPAPPAQIRRCRRNPGSLEVGKGQ